MWSAIERFSLQGVQFIIQIILARLLLPSDYGMIGMLAIFLQVAQVFIDSGFTNALIQKKIELKRILPLSFILIFLSQYYSMVYCFFRLL
ncbi:oligosaccharide flippase family protein [Bacteroides thetaiotaomicron]|nr:oligosaccharide flippase family protein [Bacteroides thetaiotaomicron]